MVTRKSNDTIRLCLDRRDLNKAIRRTPCHVRAIDDVIPKVSGASHFSILGARSGFWQVELDDESSKLLDCEQSLFFFRFSKGRARARER